MTERLCASPVLQSPDFSLPFAVQTNASDRGVGAVLTKQGKDGGEHPIAYFSRKLLPHEHQPSRKNVWLFGWEWRPSLFTSWGDLSRCTWTIELAVVGLPQGIKCPSDQVEPRS